MARGDRAVSSFYILSDDNHFELDATETIQISETSELTSNPIQDGRQVSDHVITNNSIITFSGKISSVKSVAFRSKPDFDTPEDFIRELRRLRKSGDPVTVFVTDEVDPYQNCVVKGLELSQESGRGTFKVINDNGQKIIGGSCWNVTLVFEQYQEAQEAQLGFIEIPDPEREEQAGESDEFGDSPKRAPGRTIFKAIVDQFSGDSPPSDDEVSSVIGVLAPGGN